jgi:hypothetical protein
VLWMLRWMLLQFVDVAVDVAVNVAVDVACLCGCCGGCCDSFCCAYAGGCCKWHVAGWMLLGFFAAGYHGSAFVVFMPPGTGTYVFPVFVHISAHECTKPHAHRMCVR